MGDMDLKLRAEQLRSLSGTARSRAREELAAAGEDAVSVLVPLLTDADKQVRWEAAKALVSIGSSAAAPALVPLLEDQDAGVRWLAAEALVAAGIGVAPLVLRALIDRSRSDYFCRGALHVFRVLSRADERYREALAPVVAALDTLHAADLAPEAARDTLRSWSLVPEPQADEGEGEVQYLFDSRGDYVAFRLGNMVFDINADWVGWLPWDEPEVVNPLGEYLGTICPDDRLYALPDHAVRTYPGFPGYPAQPHVPPLPEPRGYGETLRGAKDVRLPRL